MNRIVFSIGLILTLCTGIGYSTETTTIEEQLYKKYLTGDVENARAKCLDTLNKNLDEIIRQPTVTKTKIKEVVWHANLIQSAKNKLSWLVFSETTVRLKSGTTPEPVIKKIFDASRVIENSARDLKKYRHNIKSRKDRKEVDSALILTGKILLETVVFLRNTAFC